MSKVRTESYVYTEPRTHRGHKIGERVVHVVPKGTLHKEDQVKRARLAEEERIVAMYATRGVIVAPRSQRPDPGWKHPSAFVEAGEAPRERTLATALPAPARKSHALGRV